MKTLQEHRCCVVRELTPDFVGAPVVSVGKSLATASSYIKMHMTLPKDRVLNYFTINPKSLLSIPKTLSPTLNTQKNVTNRSCIKITALSTDYQILSD